MNSATKTALRSPVAWTLASLTLAVAMHITWLPAWTIGGFIVFALWRVVLSLHQARMPSRWLRLLAVIFVVVAVLAGYRTLNGIEAGTALLSLMAGLKLLEIRTARDHVVLLFLCYFLVIAAFLRGQFLWAVPIYAGSIWLTTAALLRATQSVEALSSAACMKLSSRMLLQAAPLMLILFLLFPRVPGPFWGIQKGERASTGLSDTMSPGDISELSLSDDPAFRVRFQGPVPPRRQRYWRGPVMHTFDGYRWSMPQNVERRGETRFTGLTYDYSLMMEPSGGRWVFALDLAQSWDGKLRQTFDFQLLAERPIDERQTFRLRSRTSYFAGSAPGATLTRLDTFLPPGRNLRTLALAQQMRAESRDDADYIQRVLTMFREQEFFYTLTPPRLDFNSVDDFLFNTHNGFCAHYASAFAVLMRAAGIPARVVTGYQGGEFNRMGGYYIVRQSDAHAWNEVWLSARGWVRFDPTAAIAPERIERGSLEALGENAPLDDRLLRATPWLGDIRLAWDALNTYWRERVLDFNARSQLNLLKKLGLADPDWRSLVVAMGIALATALLLLSLKLARELKFRADEPAVRAYNRFCRRLARCGLVRAPHEGPLDFARRVGRTRPDLAAQTMPITERYIQLRYGPHSGSSSPEAVSELVALVRQFNPGTS